MLVAPELRNVLHQLINNFRELRHGLRVLHRVVEVTEASARALMAIKDNGKALEEPVKEEVEEAPGLDRRGPAVEVGELFDLEIAQLVDVGLEQVAEDELEVFDLEPDIHVVFPACASEGGLD